jgi:hypothetical protein
VLQTKRADTQATRRPSRHALSPLTFQFRISLPARHPVLLDGNPPRLTPTARTHFPERTHRFTQERVTSLRTRHGIACYDPELRQQFGWLTLTEAAAFQGVSTRTLRIAAEQRKIPGQHPLANGPWIFIRADLQTDEARKFVEYAHRPNRRTPAVLNPQQKRLGFSGT